MSILKKIKRATKSATKSVTKAVNQATDAVVDEAKDVAKTVSNVVEDTTKDVAKTIENSYNDVKKEINNLVNDAQAAILKSLSQDALKKYAQEVTAIGDIAKAIANDKELKQTLESLTKKVAAQQIDQECATLVQKILKSSVLAVHWNKIVPTTWPTITLGINGGGGYIAGAEAALGCAVTHPLVKNGQVAGYVDTGATLGASIGGGAAVTIGVASSRPSDVDGGYIGVSVEGKVGVGVGLEVTFNVPDFSLGGITAAAGVGMEASAALMGGYTFVIDSTNF